MNLLFAIFLIIFGIVFFASIRGWYLARNSEPGSNAKPAVDFVDGGDPAPLHFRTDHTNHHHDSSHDFGGHSGGHDSVDGGHFDGGFDGGGHH